MVIDQSGTGSTLDDRLKTWMLEHQRMLQKSGGSPAETHVITVTQDLGIDFQVTISKFDVQTGDTTSYKWHDGETQRELEMPPYFITDMEGATRNMLDASKRDIEASIRLLLRGANPIQRKTIEAARRHAKTTQVSRRLAFTWFWRQQVVLTDVATDGRVLLSPTS